MTFLPLVANAGVPMLALQLPAQVLALGPIVANEAPILARTLAVPWRTLWPQSAANLASSFIAVPVAWGALLALERRSWGRVHVVVDVRHYSGQLTLI
jgi:hypothetical protein